MGKKSTCALLIFFVSLVGGVLCSKASALDQITHADCGLVPSFSVVWVGVDAGIFKKMVWTLPSRRRSPLFLAFNRCWRAKRNWEIRRRLQG